MSRAAGGGRGAPATPLDRGLRQDDGARVSWSAFSLLFSEMCCRANTVPTKVRSVTEVEARVAALGHHVGSRTVQLSAVREAGTVGGSGGGASASFQRRQTSAESVLRLIAERQWVRWFGRPAEPLERDTEQDRWYIIDSDPIVTRHAHPHAEFVDSDGQWTLTYAAFVAGMVRGALDTCGFPATVQAVHQAELGRPHRHVFIIEFDPIVTERERRLRQ